MLLLLLVLSLMIEISVGLTIRMSTTSNTNSMFKPFVSINVKSQYSRSLSSSTRTTSTNSATAPSLSNYMSLSPQRFTRIRMPLNSRLLVVDTIDALSRFRGFVAYGNLKKYFSSSGSSVFILTVPPVRFFHLDVSPNVICRVTQTNSNLVIQR